MGSINKILKTEFSYRFVDLMKQSMVMSHYKYGRVKDNYPHLSDAVSSLKQRLELYEKTGNSEYLVDVANFAMIEFMLPRHPDAHYTPTDSDKSPGVVGGSSKEIADEMGDNYKLIDRYYDKLR